VGEKSVGTNIRFIYLRLILNQCENFQNIISDDVIISENGEYVFLLTKFSKDYIYSYKINVIDYKQCKLLPVINIDTKKIKELFYIETFELQEFNFDILTIKYTLIFLID
jgi:hypothetical protein